MSSTLAERLARESLKGSCASAGAGNKNLALFLSQSAEIQDALDLGWSVRAIWRHLHKEGKFLGTYECFLGYVKKRLNVTKYVSPTSRGRSLASAPRPMSGVSQEDTTPKEDAIQGRIAGFEFKPVFDAKELYGEEE